MSERILSTKNEREINDKAATFSLSVSLAAGNKSFSKCPDYDTIINTKRLFSLL